MFPESAWQCPVWDCVDGDVRFVETQGILGILVSKYASCTPVEINCVSVPPADICFCKSHFNICDPPRHHP